MTPRQLQSIAKAKGLEVSVSSPIGMARLPRNGKGPQVLTDAELRWSVEFSVPCRVVSEANRRDGWRAELCRKHNQESAVLAAWLAIGAPRLLHPCTVTLTHIGRQLDGDNLQRAMKKIRDVIASRILERDDADPEVAWDYLQRLGQPGVEVRIESRNE